MKIRRKKPSPYRSSRLSRRKLVAIILIPIILIVAALLLFRNNAPDNPADQTVSSRTASQKGAQGSNAGTSTSDKFPASSASTSGAGPMAPYGNFVSNHNAGFNDSEASNCLTSPGAKCKISFTKDGMTKTLEEKTTNADGAASWSWKPQDLDLTAGAWQINAVATMNGQTANASDSLKLTIQP